MRSLLTKSGQLPNRFITALEVFLIVVLAIVVVIYAQVLWQQFKLGSSALPAPNEVSDISIDNDSTLSEEERKHIQDSLEQTEAEQLSAEDRQQILQGLGTESKAPMITEEEKAAIIDALLRTN